MNETYQHTDAKKSTLVDGTYQELDASGKVVFSYKFRHGKSVTFEFYGGLVMEFDKWDRTTFSCDSKGYWCLKFYEEPTDPHKVDKLPFHVVHKH
jgi:hypothetical protein